MMLHELHKRAEWYDIADTERTSWQRLAARSQGLVTPGNITTLTGAILTAVGLIGLYSRSYSLALVLIALGRFCDLLDGTLARKTHTSSPIGEGLDAIVDKVAIVAFVTVAFLAHFFFVIVIFPVFAVQVCIAAVVLVARQLDIHLHPSRLGKYTTFGLWLAILWYLLALTLGDHSLDQVASSIMLFVFVGSVATFIRYTMTIGRRLLQKKQKHRL